MFKQDDTMVVEIPDVAGLLQWNVKIYKFHNRGQLPTKIIVPKLHELSVDNSPIPIVELDDEDKGEEVDSSGHKRASRNRRATKTNGGS